tara:strand:+ start:133657 stop:134541 length:885 start_codon:yes stop_codon:yes gene_type:complete
MKVENYLRSMLPSMEKVSIKEDLRNLKEELDGKSIPPFVSASEFFSKDYTFKSRDVQELQKIVDRRVDHKAKNLVLLTRAALEQSTANVNSIIDLVEKHYSNDVVRDGMTYLKVNINQYIESMSFMSMYARRLLLVVYGLEAMGSSEAADKALSRDLNWVRKRFNDFLVCVKANLKNDKVLKKELEAIPDMQVKPESAAAVRETVGLDKIDPNSFGLISARLNPIYHIRMAWTKWQVHRLRQAEEEKELLEFKLAYLRNERSGKKDAKLEEVIERYEARVQKLQYKTQEMLEDE